MQGDDPTAGCGDGGSTEARAVLLAGAHDLGAPRKAPPRHAASKKKCRSFPRPPTGQRSIKSELPRSRGLHDTRNAVPFEIFAASATLQSSPRPLRASKASPHRNQRKLSHAKAVF